LAPADYSSKALSVRYSGVRLSGGAGQGALYLASMAGLLREHVHYSGGGGHAALWRPGAADVTQAAVKREIAGVAAPAGPPGAKHFHVYQLNSALQLLDLRVQSLTTAFTTLLATPAASSRFGLSAATTAFLLVQTVLDPHDYSAARGMADAAHDWGRTRGITGLVATSARGDSDSGVILYDHGDGVEGLVFALFGAAGQRLDVLTPLGSYATFQDLVAAVRAMPGFQSTM
jgi:hypothetical protein